MDNIDLTPIINGAIALIFALVSAYVIPWLKAKIGAQKYDQLLSIVKIAVSAAEQIYFGQDLGAQKKAYVLDILRQNGYDVDVASIDAMIEAEVLKLQK